MLVIPCESGRSGSSTQLMLPHTELLTSTRVYTLLTERSAARDGRIDPEHEIAPIISDNDAVDVEAGHPNTAEQTEQEATNERAGIPRHHLHRMECHRVVSAI
jgi:hypothetical protein